MLILPQIITEAHRRNEKVIDRSRRFLFIGIRWLLISGQTKAAILVNASRNNAYLKRSLTYF